jgi:hypothetical protein
MVGIIVVVVVVVVLLRYQSYIKTIVRMSDDTKDLDELF